MLNQDIILKELFELNDPQIELIKKFQALVIEFNKKINLISRKDIDNLFERHIMHSLSISKIINFAPESRVLDIGTGGGFPGIPLAIKFPNVKFCLIDSITKKINTVTKIVKRLNLKNIEITNIRSEKYFPKINYDFIVSRAVAALDKFCENSLHLISKVSHNKIPNGILYLKGANSIEKSTNFEHDVMNSLQNSGNDCIAEKISNIYKCHRYYLKKIFPTFPFFDTKVLIHIHR